ncbi:hypothetical protein [Dasania marina]|uniref:tetratricopeptide repeat protein n=1 Tax=Dasania marina TaxID=471499 RepID=UPI0030DC526C
MIKKLLLSITLTLALSPLTLFADASDDYRSGINAFKTKDYSQAIQFFLSAKNTAEKEGTSTANLSEKLDYNLGSSYYKAQRYSESASHFNRLTNSSQWSAMAHYNLGLIAEKTHQPSQAAQHFTLAYQNASSEKIKKLAALKLQQQETLNTSYQAWRGIISAAVGHDSNIALFPDNNTHKQQSDNYLEAWASAENYLRGNYNNGLHINISAFKRHYMDNSDYNFTGFDLAISREKQHTTWHSSSTLTTAAYFTDGNISSKIIALAFEAERPYRDINLHLDNQTQYTLGQSSYDYITGWSNETAAFLSYDSSYNSNYKNKKYSIKTGYQLTVNNRKDLPIEDDFYSYSPTQHDYFLHINYRINPQLWLQLESQYSVSHYNDSNKIVDSDGNTHSEKRRDKKISHLVRASYSHGKQWLSFVEYSNNNKRSNMDYYAYHRWQLSIGIEKTF